MALGFVEGFNAADPALISTHGLLRAEVASERSGGSTQARISEGYGALVESLERQLHGRDARIVTGARVRLVKWANQKVEVTADVAGRSQVFSADAVVVTVSLGVLKSGSICFAPSLAGKQDAIDSLLFGSALKLALIFREVWWGEHDFGFVHSFGAEIPTWWSDPRGAVLTGWAGGPKADALSAMPVGARTRNGLEILAGIFSEKVSVLESLLVGAHTYDWARDPEIGGAYSYIPVRGLDLPKLLAEPSDETVFFAGEATATDAQMGTVFGAVESGLRVAAEVMGKAT